MKVLKILAIISVLFSFSSAAFAAEEKSGERQSDLWLEAKIVTTYTLNQYLNPFKLDVDVKNGVAYLSGTVDSEVERDLAVQIARGVEGVKKVEDGIKIEPGSLAEERRESQFFRTVEDATITSKVKSKLLWNRNTSGLDINVDTENGIVTLKGKVSTEAHENLAVQLAKNTTGVERVKSELKVVPEKAGKKGTLETMEATANDVWITSKVKWMLLFSKEAAGADIEVNTSDQVVTLKGTVISEEQKKTILKMVGDITGVEKVTPELVVMDKA
jgi:osmotically-inducible protein OsmY